MVSTVNPWYPSSQLTLLPGFRLTLSLFSEFKPVKVVINTTICLSVSRTFGLLCKPRLSSPPDLLFRVFKHFRTFGCFSFSLSVCLLDSRGCYQFNLMVSTFITYANQAILASFINFIFRSQLFVAGSHYFPSMFPFSGYFRLAFAFTSQFLHRTCLGSDTPHWFFWFTFFSFSESNLWLSSPSQLSSGYYQD